MKIQKYLKSLQQLLFGKNCEPAKSLAKKLVPNKQAPPLQQIQVAKPLLSIHASLLDLGGSSPDDKDPTKGQAEQESLTDLELEEETDASQIPSRDPLAMKVSVLSNGIARSTRI